MIKKIIENIRLKRKLCHYLNTRKNSINPHEYKRSVQRNIITLYKLKHIHTYTTHKHKVAEKSPSLLQLTIASGSPSRRVTYEGEGGTHCRRGGLMMFFNKRLLRHIIASSLQPAVFMLVNVYVKVVIKLWKIKLVFEVCEIN